MPGGPGPTDVPMSGCSVGVAVRARGWIDAPRKDEEELRAERIDGVGAVARISG